MGGKRKGKQPADPVKASAPRAEPVFYKPGRPTLLSPTTQEEICNRLLACSTLEDAARSLGLNVGTVHGWMHRGRAEGSGPYFEFLEAVETARSKRRLAFEARLTKEKDWKAQAWLMERTQPKRYGLRIRVHVEEEIDGFLERIKERVPREVFEQVLEAAVNSSREGGDDPESDEGGEVSEDSRDGAPSDATPAGTETGGVPST